MQSVAVVTFRFFFITRFIKALFRGVALHQSFAFSNTRLNDISYGIKIWTDLSFVLSQITGLTDRRTDRQTECHSYMYNVHCVCIPCSAVKRFGVRRHISWDTVYVKYQNIFDTVIFSKKMS